ncbi:MAG: serine hydrolase [Verrucomicrobiaceae bacterium]|nr:serine hydrolase [Verrucomicrobiaceae bacterium]
MAWGVVGLPWLGAAEATTLAKNAERLAVSLPEGCIVIGETVAGGRTVYSLIGKVEDRDVAPEKRIFEIGSLSKVFTGVLLAQAVAEKRVTLDSTLAEVLKGEVEFNDAKVAGITLRQLAAHTSGLPRIPNNMKADESPDDPYVAYGWTELCKYLSEARLERPPPCDYAYSNLGVGLLGDVLARLYGKSWEELVKERITGPLGMKDTAVNLSDEQKSRVMVPYAGARKTKPWTFKTLAGAGALRSTAADLMIFLEAIAHPEKTTMGEALELIKVPQFSGRTGLCLQRLELKNEIGYWHTGGTGGFKSWMSTKPKSGRHVVILINNRALSADDVVTGKLPVAAEPPDASLVKYLGVFDTGIVAEGTAIHYTMEARGKVMWMQITGQDAIPLTVHPTGADRFEFKPVNAEIQFKLRDGEAETVTLFQAGQEIVAKRVKK